MNIIAIDPGPTTSAMVLWDGSKIIQKFEATNELMREWIANKAPHCLLAVEMVACYGMPVGAETFNTVLFIGRLQEIWLSKGNPFKLVYRREVKIHLCQSMKAKDGNVRQALMDKLGPQGVKKAPGPTYGVSGHLWSALAIAVTTWETNQRIKDVQIII